MGGGKYVITIGGGACSDDARFPNFSVVEIFKNPYKTVKICELLGLFTFLIQYHGMGYIRNWGSFINHVNNIFGIFDTLSLALWTILFHKAYLVIRIFGKPPSPPAMST